MHFFSNTNLVCRFPIVVFPSVQANNMDIGPDYYPSQNGGHGGIYLDDDSDEDDDNQQTISIQSNNSAHPKDFSFFQQQEQEVSFVRLFW